MREIDWRIKNIVKRNNQSIEFEAKIHGIEIKAPKINVSSVEKVELNESQAEAIALAQLEAKKRIGKRHGRR